MSKRILLTGAGGFVGSHCVQYWLEKTDWEIICLDSFRHKGYVRRIQEVGGRLSNLNWNDDWESRVKIYTHDLTVPIDLPLENLIMGRTLDDRGVIKEKPLHAIVNMASDSAVERSVSDPVHCWHNNCSLIATMLEFARKTNPKVFLQVSTDEVFGEAPPKPHPGHHEWDVIMPSNAYAASKAAQEALSIAYWRTYKVPVVITNCMNIIGEWQDPEKFLPKIIQFIAQDKKQMPIYADKVKSMNEANHHESNEFWNIGSRVYLDARNKADALMFLMNKNPTLYDGDYGNKPDRYNICGDVEVDNLQLAKMVSEIMEKQLDYKLVPSESARPGYDRRYALDGRKLRDLGWQQPVSFKETLKRVVHWTVGNPHWLV
jgi:dTDP-glucose 4,6-dehydratase